MLDETKIPLIERDIKCLTDFKKDITQKFDNRKPAELTLEFISKTNLEMQKQTVNLESLTKTLDTHVQDQKVHETKLQENLEKYQEEVFGKLAETQSTITDFISSVEEKSKQELANYDKRYAPKAVYKVILWAGGIVGTALIIGALTLIYRSIIFFVDK